MSYGDRRKQSSSICSSVFSICKPTGHNITMNKQTLLRDKFAAWSGWPYSELGDSETKQYKRKKWIVADSRAHSENRQQHKQKYESNAIETPGDPAAVSQTLFSVLASLGCRSFLWRRDVHSRGRRGRSPWSARWSNVSTAWLSCAAPSLSGAGPSGWRRSHSPVSPVLWHREGNVLRNVLAFWERITLYIYASLYWQPS